jgi:hypothetical protein
MNFVNRSPHSTQGVLARPGFWFALILSGAFFTVLYYCSKNDIDLKQFLEEKLASLTKDK